MVKSDPKTILRDNVEALMRNWYGKINVTRFGKDTGIQVGGAQRALSGEANIGLELVAAIARRARLAPWQVLVPDLDPISPPTLAAPTAGEPGEMLDLYEQQLIELFRGMSAEHREDLLLLANRWAAADGDGHPSRVDPYPRVARRKP